jgi:Alkaline phosphatase PhoX
VKALQLAAAAGALAALAAAPAAVARQPAPGAGGTGPSTDVAPYVVPVADGVSTTALLSAGDMVPSADGPGLYKEGGIPDGLGALRADGRRITVLENHEWSLSEGVTPRRHGQPHSYVSELTLDRKRLAVVSEGDLIDPGVQYWDYAAGGYAAAASAPFTDAFVRFCSGTLSDPGQFFDRGTRLGYRGQIYFANEENGDLGRVFGVTLDGAAKQLPRLGLSSWENTKPAPNATESTVVIGNEDAGSNADPAGQLWVYTGTKRSRGDAFARAGLTDGSLQVLAAADPAVHNDIDWRAEYGKGVPGRVRLAGVDWRKSGAQQNADAKAAGLSLTRIEDGHWDPRHPRDYYFVTTQGGKDTTAARDGGGLWRLRLDDVDDPDAGGELTLLLDGSEAIGLNKPDNMAIDTHGNLLLQEDPGGNDHIARILAYRLSTGVIATLARFDPARFGAGAPGLITTDEESSGIIDTEGLLGSGTFLFDAQVHAAFPDPDVVEYGQLLRLHVGDWAGVYEGGQPTRP